jgi:GNAT superfamily N-acetyltransferase
MSDTTIRPVIASDRSQWGALWQDYLAFYETTVPDSTYDSTFERLLGDDPRDFNGVVADQNGTLIGLAHYLSHRHAWKIENVIYLQDLYVAPQARGTGSGRKLIQAVYDIADEQNAGGVYWLTQDFNETARKLYDRIGTVTPFIRYQRP